MINVDRLTQFILSVDKKGALSQCLMHGWLELDMYEDFN